MLSTQSFLGKDCCLLGSDILITCITADTAIVKRERERTRAYAQIACLNLILDSSEAKDVGINDTYISDFSVRTDFKLIATFNNHLMLNITCGFQNALGRKYTGCSIDLGIDHSFK